MTFKHLLLGLGLVCAGLFTSAARGLAQEQQSTTSGTVVTGSDVAGGAFSPSAGTVSAEASPAVATATAAAGTAIVAQLAAGTLTAPSGVTIPASVQGAVLGIVNGVSTPAAVAQLATTLATSGVSAAATALAESLQNIIASPSTGQLAQAVGHYNTLVNGAGTAFLTAPPAEFLAVQSVLVQLVQAAASAQ